MLTLLTAPFDCFTADYLFTSDENGKILAIDEEAFTMAAELIEAQGVYVTRDVSPFGGIEIKAMTMDDPCEEIVVDWQECSVVAIGTYRGVQRRARWTFE